MREDWIEVELGEICFTTSGGTPSRNNIEFYQGSIPWVKSGELDKGIIYDTEEHISEEAVKKSSAKIFPEGSLLIALYGATIGKLAFLGVEAATNQAICGIYKSQVIESKYLFNFLLNRKQKLISQGTGGAQPNISQTILKKLEIPLAPLPIQRAIVSKIEALFSDLDNGIANLKKAQDQLKIYRQAVLKKAFEGKLSELGKGGLKDDKIIDKDNKQKEILQSQNPKNPNSDNKEDNLPKGWKWVKISEISNVVRGGSPRPAGDPKYYDGNIPFLKVRDITKDTGKYLTTFEYTIKEAGLHKTRQIKPNTLLLSNSGATLGVPKICMIDATMNDGIAAFLDLDERSNLYLYYFWLSKTKELRNINMGAAQPNLNTDIIKNYLVPYCSFEEQTQIVQEIESRLSVCDKMEQILNESIAKSEALRQSILKKAFEGKLLSKAEIELCKKEADYEPASELLKKIKAEKLAAAQEKKKPIIQKKSKQ